MNEKSATNKKERIFSGAQPTGNLHIGNYLGALRQWVALQSEYDSIFCVVDLHAITTYQDPVVLRQKTREVVGLLVAAGIDPTFSTIFVQSHIPAHAELAWILECETPMGWLRRMTQFKEKAEDEGASVSAGLFNYPDLMAADILLYDTDAVPVGDDQVQHLELTRDVAQRFNSLYGETFVIPRAIVAETGARVMGLDDATKKMSKSTDVPGHAIYLLDPEPEIRAKISRATTDSSREIRFEETRPAIANLLSIYEAFTGTGRPEIEAHFAGRGYAVLKKELAEVVITALRPLQERYREVTAQPGWVDKILDEGEARVRPIAERTLARVKDRMGLG